MCSFQHVCRNVLQGSRVYLGLPAPNEESSSLTGQNKTRQEDTDLLSCLPFSKGYRILSGLNLLYFAEPKRTFQTSASVLSQWKLTLSINIAQKPYIIGSLDRKALKYESFEGKGSLSEKPSHPGRLAGLRSAFRCIPRIWQVAFPVCSQTDVKRWLRSVLS